MKYIYITTLLIMSLVFTGCFEKPVETDQPEINETVASWSIVVAPEPVQEDDSLPTDSEDIAASGSVNENVNDPETINPEGTTEESEVVITASWSQSEQEIIEEYEEDLEELFNDILGS